MSETSLDAAAQPRRRSEEIVAGRRRRDHRGRSVAAAVSAFRDALLAAFRDHHVLVFRDQDLSKEEQLAFTQQFGEIEEHVGRHAAAARYGLVHTVTNLDDDGKPTTKLTQTGNYHWHTDKSYHAVPSLMTLLHAKELPPAGRRHPVRQHGDGL